MKSRHSNLSRMLFLWVGVLHLASCGKEEYEFTRKVTTTPPTVIIPKVWSDLTYLEPNSASPAVDGSNRSFLAFNFASNGTNGYLAASFYDSNATLFRGFTRFFDGANGWAAPGSKDFSMVATHATSLGHPTIAAGSSGEFMAAFFSSATNVGVSSSYRGGYWRTATTTTGLNGFPSVTGTDNMDFGPAVASAFESDTKAVIYTDLDTPLEVHRFHWDSTNGINTTGTNDSLGNGSGATRRRIQALKDGTGRICLTYEGNPSADHLLYAKCYNISSGTTETTAQLSTAKMSGHAAATDGAGNIWVAFFQLVSGKYEVMVTQGVNGTWSSSPTQVSSAAGTGYDGVPSVAASATGHSPGIVHLGSGKLLVAWIGVSTSSKSTILYATYAPSTGWSGAQTYEDPQAYVTRPHHENLTLLAAGTDLAVLAVTNITIEDGGGTHLDTRRQLLSYYMSTTGWGTAAMRGNGCKPGAAAKLSACTHHPVGAVLPAQGNAVVVFADKDSADRFRLASVELK